MIMPFGKNFSALNYQASLKPKKESLEEVLKP
jgi:hypothetical protein